MRDPLTARVCARRRICLVAAMAAVLLAALASRELFPRSNRILGDLLADALYSTFFYLLLSALWLRGHSLVKALIIVLFCAAIEFLQLTDIPRQLSSQSKILALLLGWDFSWADLVAYVVGAGVPGLIELRLSHRSP